MSLPHVCYKCGDIGIPVKSEPVKHFAKRGIDETTLWRACTNPVCEVAYYSEIDTVLAKDLKRPLWYKNSSDNVPICYCANITRGDIRGAVLNGCTTIKEVREYTGKKSPCNCGRLHPLGKCCSDSFLVTINEYMNQKLIKEEKMKIEILGTGCPKCKTLTNLVTQAVADNDIEAVISKVEDIQEIMNYGVMSTPGLVIDGEVKLVGRVPAMKELLELLKGNTKGTPSDKADKAATSSCCCGSGGCC